jgi:hypothetical protein
MVGRRESIVALRRAFLLGKVAELSEIIWQPFAFSHEVLADRLSV